MQRAALARAVARSRPAARSAARAPPTCHASLLHRRRPRSAPTAGPVPISASTSATSGARVTNNPTRPSGVAGGVQGGYNWQSGQFVFGGEADLQISGADDTFAPWKFSNPWFGTVRGRAGYRPQQRPVLRHRRPRLRRRAGARSPGLLTESKTAAGLDRGRRRRGRLHAELVGARSNTCSSICRPPYALTGISNGLGIDQLRLRRQLSLLTWRSGKRA